jgi:hypothetical protein
MDSRDSLFVVMFQHLNMLVHCRKCERTFRAEADGQAGEIRVDDSAPTRRPTRRYPRGR